MWCHRGHPLRAPSSSSSDSPSLSSDFFADHYPRTCSGRGHFHDSSHYLGSPAPRPPTTMPSPMTSFTLFSFNCSLNRPRITTHITVVFHEEAQLGEPSSHPAGLGSDNAQTLNLQMGIASTSTQAPDAQARSAHGVEMAPVNLGPSESESALARDLLATGWCRIVEEPPDD